MTQALRALHALAMSHGVQLSFTDYRGRIRRASPEALLAVLRALGVEIQTVGDAPATLRAAPVRDKTIDRAPKASSRAPAVPGRWWGVFLPLYALRTERGLGVADFTDLEALLAWTRHLGGQIVATLPLFAAFLDDPFDPSPYSPVSRLFYNELYVDAERTPEFSQCEAARELVASPTFRTEVDRLRSCEYVDHRGAYELKRRVLQHLAECFFAQGAARLRALVEAEPLLAEYARFRAGGDPGAERFHLYAQLVAHEQLDALTGSGEGGLLLDMPLGVHPDGFDGARFPDVFATGVTVGAPPDDLFAGGQDWGFHPVHPERGGTYFEKTIRKLMRHAAVVRIDHVMGLHRQYWIPRGMSPEEGVYVRYPAQHLYATLVREARSEGTIVVGEDLGTVPSPVRTTMRKRGLLSTHVMQFSTTDDPKAAVDPPPPDSLACLNTHDTKPFAAFWEQLPSHHRSAVAQYLGADPDRTSVHRGVLHSLASGDSPILLVNIEDLWGEHRPQNEPGTSFHERPNWTRRTERAFEHWSVDREVVSTLTEIDRIRGEEVA